MIALTGEDATLLEIAGASALNAFVALLGYYAAAAIVDDPDCGRLTLQQTSFIITGTLFFCTERDLFLFSGYASFAASLSSFLTIPETTSLGLYGLTSSGNTPATDPKFLSFYDRNQNRFYRSRR